MIGYFMAALVIGYFLGCIQSGYFIGKISGLDIRNYGSGNAGATNVLRVLGKGKALGTFLGDALKGFIPVLVIKYFIGPAIFGTDPSGVALSQMLQLVVGFGAVMGHDYPFFLHFKGGKGISTTGAVMMAFDPRMGFLCIILFLLVVVPTRYVSLGSCIIMAALVVEIVIFYPGRMDLLIMCILFALFAIYRHRANIKRLLNGTESKIGQKVEVKK